jgi:ketosteroid isomerase-like protein
MKKYVLTLFAIILLAGTSCQEKIDIEKEKEAIKAVIEEETNAFLARDFDRLAATYVQDETNIDLRAGESGYGYYVGWEEIGSAFKELFENNPEPGTSKEVKTNYKIKVYKESAWTVFDNEVYNSEGELTGKSIHVEFLEKVNGEWKIVYLSIVNTSSYEDEEDDDDEEIEEGEEEPETEDAEED